MSWSDSHLEQVNGLSRKFFGECFQAPESEGRLSADKAAELLKMCAADCAHTAGMLQQILPHASRDWLYGASDWSKRGHAVVGVALLMYSAVSRLRQGAPSSAFSYDEAIRHMWPNLVPLGSKIACAIPAATDPSSMKAMLNMLANPSVRRTLASVDEDSSVLPDARSQILLTQAGLIVGAAGSGVTIWRLTQKPIGKEALLSICSWYREALRSALAGLQPVVEKTKHMERYLADAALLIAAGEVSRQIGAPTQAQKESGLGSLFRKMLGGTRVLGVSLWANPWETQQVLRLLSEM